MTVNQRVSGSSPEGGATEKFDNQRFMNKFIGRFLFGAGFSFENGLIIPPLNAEHKASHSSL